MWERLKQSCWSMAACWGGWLYHLSRWHSQRELLPKVGGWRAGCLEGSCKCRLSCEAVGKLFLVPRRLFILIYVLYFYVYNIYISYMLYYMYFLYISAKNLTIWNLSNLWSFLDVRDGIMWRSGLGIGVWQIWYQLLSQPLASYMALGKLHNFSDLQFPHL